MFWCYENSDVAKMVKCENSDGILAVAYASERYDA